MFMALTRVMVLIRVMVYNPCVSVACVVVCTGVLLLARHMVLITENLIRAQCALGKSGRQWISYFVYYGLTIIIIILLSDHN